eukprot:SAG11_NODE_11416_length_762_cov_1.093514_1_plen_131_part_10
MEVAKRQRSPARARYAAHRCVTARPDHSLLFGARRTPQCHSVVRGDCTPEGLKGGTEFGAMMARQQLIWQQVAGVLGKRESTLLTSPQVSPPSQVPLSITAQCGREPARLRIVALRAAHGSRSSACAVKLL